ncbi:methyltransferase [Micromonospora sp. Llam0]|uniref:methyltransferase n=1 Tax=Micromonospora sp. Llam0 TaxID=2485143 RepID=UPI000F49DE1D|nr:methyltransferase [Micromonospora sp. Llam0]
MAEELRSTLPQLGKLYQVDGRSDSLEAEYAGDWQRLLHLRTIVAPFLVLSFPVPRPRSLASGEHFSRLLEAMRLVSRINNEPIDSFRIDAAGKDSPTFRRLAGQIQQSTGLAEVAEGGHVLLRFRRSTRLEGWDVLVRLSLRPLSNRDWRVQNLPGAANASIAAAMSLMTSPRSGDRVLNLMCGSGTLLVERLQMAPAKLAVGVDIDSKALGYCAQNLEAAGFHGRANLVNADLADDKWLEWGQFDVILADPPWGALMGDHDSNETLHTMLLDRAHAAAAPRSCLAVLTHEIRIMERCLRRAASKWSQSDVLRVFQKGHNPRIYLLTKR